MSSQCFCEADFGFETTAQQAKLISPVMWGIYTLDMVPFLTALTLLALDTRKDAD
jgi:hypothetical protein